MNMPPPPPAEPRHRPTNISEFKELLAQRAPFPAPSFDLRPTDVFVATYPKCGTTWTQQIVHGLRTRGSMDFVEISLVVPWVETAPMLGIDLDAPQAAEPRAFKTHLSWDLVPKGGRYIYVMREPGDALLSFYHFMNGWTFERDAIDVNTFGPETFFGEQPFGRYWEHLSSWWEQRRRDDVLFLCFEDMKRDLEGAVRRIAAFIGVPGDEERIAIATRQSTIEFMRAHEGQFDDHPCTLAFNRLMGLPLEGRTTKVRAGRVGDAKAALSAETRARLDEEWSRVIGERLGIRSYEEMRARLAEGA